MGCVCDFETRLDSNSSLCGQAFSYLHDADEAIATVSGCAHSGNNSLRLRSSGHHVRAKAIGCSFHLAPDRQYRLSGWVKTSLTQGGARIQAHEYRFNLENTLGFHDTVSVNGETDRMYVSVEWVPGELAHVVDI